MSDPPRVCLLGVGGAVAAEDDGAETVRRVALPALVREIQRIDTIRHYAGQRFVLCFFPFPTVNCIKGLLSSVQQILDILLCCFSASL